MQTIIADLWQGNITPARELEAASPQIREILQLMERNSEALCELLNEKQKEAFEKYYDCVEEYLDLMTEQAFCSGFCLGGKLMASALVTGNFGDRY